MKKKKSIDITITTLFLIYWGYYALMGMVFGGTTKENSLLYVAITIIGLILIWISSLVKSVKNIAWIRFVGLILIHSLLYFDIKVSGGFEEPWELIEYLSLGYLPVIVFVIFSIYHVFKLSYINRQNASNTGLPNSD